MAFTAAALDHLVLNVADVEVSAGWYQRVLGMARQDAAGRTSVRFGNQKINLRPVAMSKDSWRTADHPRAGSEDLCFLTNSTADEIVAHLRGCGVAIELGPIKRRGAMGEMTSVYCRDPDGSLIEIATYGS
jgi:catechol 2,3-dioxygenase-like lactoylglutathione lyase family enzyme